jgi:hypothetical protein
VVRPSRREIFACVRYHEQRTHVSKSLETRMRNFNIHASGYQTELNANSHA